LDRKSIIVSCIKIFKKKIASRCKLKVNSKENIGISMKKYNEINDNFLNLIKIVKKLRDKDNGCLWCNSQTSESIAKYSIEEANEVVEAIDKGNSSEICEELGDLLFQVIFHSQIKSDEKEFDINDVIKSINKKMIRRNPHVFNNKNNKEYTLDEIEENWIKIKNEEKFNQ
tara:strand:+ start:278 stop:790 length:513 start_codon:yes stop_codon:yes gene_type:complete